MDDTEVRERIGQALQVSNEFAFVRIQKVLTGNGERLEIEAPKLRKRVLLDAIELESLSWQTPESFSRLLETPFGP